MDGCIALQPLMACILGLFWFLNPLSLPLMVMAIIACRRASPYGSFPCQKHFPVWPYFFLLRALQLVLAPFLCSLLQLNLSIFSSTLVQLRTKILWTPFLHRETDACLLLCLLHAPWRATLYFLVVVSLFTFLQHLAHSSHLLRIL